MPRKLLILTLAALFSLLAIAPGMAQSRPTIRLGQSTVTPGSEVEVQGSGFHARDTLTVRLDGERRNMPIVRVGADGRFAIDVHVPSRMRPGTYDLTVSVRGRDLAKAPLTVIEQTGSVPSPTPERSVPEASATDPPVVVVASPTPVPATVNAKPAATATTAPTSAPTSTPISVPTSPVATAGPALNFEAEVVVLTNLERANAGVPSLTSNAALGRAAHDYAAVMAGSNCVAHTCGPVPDFAKRITAAGYTGWTMLGENVAAGQSTPAEVVSSWMASPGHRANILNPAFRDIGVGEAMGDGTFGIYWAQEFGAQ